MFIEVSEKIVMFCNFNCRGDEEKELNYFAATTQEHPEDCTSSDDEPRTDVQTRSSEQIQNSETRLPNPLATGEALPSPSFAASYSDGFQNSVFLTSFQRAEEAKQSILERHVKMTNEVAPDKKKKRQICHNFLKGMCRYGQKCRYNHDVDDKSGDMDDTAPPVAFVRGPAGPRNPRQFNCVGSSGTRPQRDDDDEDGFDAMKKRQKRSGITNSLVPPKRALHLLEKDREQERPWTVKR